MIPGLIKKINYLEVEIEKFIVDEELKGVGGNDDEVIMFTANVKGSARSNSCGCRLFVVVDRCVNHA